MQTVPFHPLKCLSIDDCWEVFKQNAFGDQDPNDHPDLVEIGLKIAAKCGGLPLAAKSLGGLLSYENEVGAWEDVLQSDVWDLGGESTDGIIPALRLSYLHLDSHLKQCFLYVSIFPKDFKFEKDEIVLLWMAQGFLQCRGSKQQARDLGYKCFEELHQRCFFQCYSVRAWEMWGKPFVMHDLIHDLAQQISGGEFFHMDGDKAPLWYPRDVCHVSLIKQGAGDLEEVWHAPWSNIRTLICRYTPKNMKLSSQLMSHLKFLRTLDLAYSHIYELPDSIGDLIFLRYLNLDRTYISSLPESICKLYNLQTLSLKGCGQLGRLPKNIKNFCNLEHVNISGTSLDFIPSGFGKLTSLRTLDEFPVIQNGGPTSADEMGGIELLKELNHLSGVLAISQLKNMKDAQDAKRADLRKKREMKELVLTWNGANTKTMDTTSPPQGEQTQVLENLQPPDRLEALEIRDFRGLGFPSWMVGDLSSLSRLVKVVIKACTFCTPLPPLGQLPCLKHLEISCMYMVEAVGYEFYGPAAVAFPKLEELKFSDMWKWVSWEMPTEEQVVFPRLRHLSLLVCPMLKLTVPLYLLRALEVLTIEDCVELISIDLGSHGLSSSSDLDQTGLPPLRTLRIWRSPQARFSPEDGDHLSLPTTLRNLTIMGSPLLLEWCERCARVPNAKIWISPWYGGSKILSTEMTHDGVQLHPHALVHHLRMGIPLTR